MNRSRSDAQRLQPPHLVVIAADAAGQPTFVQAPAPAEMTVQSLAGVVSLWDAPARPRVPDDVGGGPPDAGFAAPGRARFGRAWIAPAGEGLLDFGHEESETYAVPDDTSFHATDTLDFGVVREGEADLELPDGQVMTLRPGSCFVFAGVQHRWRVTSEVPLVFDVFSLGAARSASDDGRGLS